MSKATHLRVVLLDACRPVGVRIRRGGPLWGIAHGDRTSCACDSGDGERDATRDGDATRQSVDLFYNVSTDGGTAPTQTARSPCGKPALRAWTTIAAAPRSA